MKNIFSIFSIAILSFALGIFLPWWSIAIAGFLIPLFIEQKPLMAFLSGFVSIFLLWGLYSFFINQSNHDILANKISMLILKRENPLMLVTMTALIGGIVTGFASLSGSFLKSILLPKNVN